MKTFICVLALIALSTAAPGLKKSANTKLVDRINLYNLPENKLSTRRSNGKIVNGEEAIPHEFPAQVALNIDSLYFCGGSLISDTWILTAAHCCHDAQSIVATAGAHNQAINEPTQVEGQSKQIIPRDGFNFLTFKHDVCLVELTEAMPINEYISPIALGKDFIPGGVEVIAAGWGKEHDGLGGVSDTLNKVTDHTMENDECKETYNIAVHDDTLCIYYENGGTCNGDSGGPLMTGTTPEDRLLVGVTSYGSGAGCESGYPDAFQRVSYHLDWIEENSGVTAH